MNIDTVPAVHSSEWTGVNRSNAHSRGPLLLTWFNFNPNMDT